MPAGILRMNFLRFSLVTLLGAGIWCWILAWFGQEVLGSRPELLQTPDAMVAVMKEKLYWFVAAVVALGALYSIVLWAKSSRLRRA